MPQQEVPIDSLMQQFEVYRQKKASESQPQNLSVQNKNGGSPSQLSFMEKVHSPCKQTISAAALQDNNAQTPQAAVSPYTPKTCLLTPKRVMLARPGGGEAVQVQPLPLQFD